MNHYVFPLLEKQKQNMVNEVLETGIPNLVKSAIHKVLKISPQELSSPTRTRQLCDARCMYWVMLRSSTKLSLAEIGRSVHRHHSTVINGLNSHKTNIEYDEAYQDAWYELCSEINHIIKYKHVKEEV